MAFSDLSDRLTASFKRLRSRGVLTESDVDQTISEIRRALIDADVALPVVRQFTTQVREKAYGAARSRAINPGQQVVRIVHDELVEILGGETRELHFAQRGPTVFMLAGLQGAGKTTLAGKLGKWLREEERASCLSPLTFSVPMLSASFKLLVSARAFRCGHPNRVTVLVIRFKWHVPVWIMRSLTASML